MPVHSSPSTRCPEPVRLRGRAQGLEVVNSPEHAPGWRSTRSSSPSGAGGTRPPGRSMRETISDTGCVDANQRNRVRHGSDQSTSLPAVTIQTIYYVTAHDNGAQDVDTVEVFPANTRGMVHVPQRRQSRRPRVRAIPSTLSPASRILMVMPGTAGPRMILRHLAELGDARTIHPAVPVLRPRALARTPACTKWGTCSPPTTAAARSFGAVDLHDRPHPPAPGGARRIRDRRS